MGTYTPNYNLYMPSVGEQGWGDLVSNNFEILDTVILNNLNNLQDQIDVINTNIGNGTRTLTLIGSAASNIQQYWEGNVYITYMNGNYAMADSIKPSSSARLCLLICNGNLTINGSLDTYPTSLRKETPPNSTSNNVYRKTISTSYNNTVSFTYIKSNNSAVLSISKSDLKSFLDAVTYNSVNYTLSIPHAIAAGGTAGKDGTTGTASNTCNGGGGSGGSGGIGKDYIGGTGCIFGQYQGGPGNGGDGYGYGSSANNKYRCGLVIIVFGNLTLNGTITQNGGNSVLVNHQPVGGYGGGATESGGGGAPVFIYYTGTYVNNGTINTAGGSGFDTNDSSGGAGGIKTTKISI